MAKCKCVRGEGDCARAHTHTQFKEKQGSSVLYKESSGHGRKDSLTPDAHVSHPWEVDAADIGIKGHP